MKRERLRLERRLIGVCGLLDDGEMEQLIGYAAGIPLSPSSSWRRKHAPAAAASVSQPDEDRRRLLAAVARQDRRTKRLLGSGAAERPANVIQLFPQA